MRLLARRHPSHPRFARTGGEPGRSIRASRGREGSLEAEGRGTAKSGTSFVYQVPGQKRWIASGASRPMAVKAMPTPPSASAPAPSRPMPVMITAEASTMAIWNEAEATS